MGRKHPGPIETTLIGICGGCGMQAGSNKSGIQSHIDVLCSLLRIREAVLETVSTSGLLPQWRHLLRYDVTQEALLRVCIVYM